MRLKPVVPYENMAKSMVSELLARSRMEQFRDEWTQQGKLWKKKLDWNARRSNATTNLQPQEQKTKCSEKIQMFQIYDVDKSL